MLPLGAQLRRNRSPQRGLPRLVFGNVGRFILDRNRLSCSPVGEPFRAVSQVLLEQGGDSGSEIEPCHGINGLQVADIFAFLNAWFAGCP